MNNRHIVLKFFISTATILLSFPALSQFFEPQVLYHGHGTIYDSEILDVNADGMEDFILTRSKILPSGQAGVALYVYEAFMDENEISYRATITQLTNQSELYKIDYDRDGDKDLITQRTPNIWTVSHGIIENTNGRFTEFIELPDFLKDSMTQIHVTMDLDHDGYEEIIYTNDGLWSASINNGGNVVIQPLLADLFELEVLDIIDFNVDGYKDLVIRDKANNELLILMSENSLAYNAVVAETGFNFSKKYIGTSDYAGQGYLEILIFNNNTKDILAIRPDLAGGNPTTRTILNDLQSGTVFYSEDFNADGFEDFYVDGIGVKSFYLNDQNGNFTLAPSFLKNLLRGQVFHVRKDLNTNTTTIYFNSESIEKYVYENHQYNLTQIPFPDFYVQAPIVDLQVLDVDMDGIRDIAMCIISEVGGISYIKGLPQKQFGKMNLILGDEIHVDEFTLVDLNGDEVEDLVYGDQSTGYVRIKYGEGNGRFCCTEEILPSGGLVGGLFVNDFASDGFPDILVSSRSTSEILLIHNHNGIMESPISIFNEESFISGVSDIDFDSDPDIFISLQNQDTSFILINMGSNIFTPTDMGINYVRVHNFHDFDHDGQEEYVQFRDEVIIFKYDGIKYAEWINLGNTGLSLIISHAIIDYNKDGFSDLIIGRYDNPAQLYLNEQNQAFIDDGLFSDKFGFDIPNDIFSSEFSGHDLDSDGDTDLFYSWKNNVYWVSQIHGHQSVAGINFWDLNTDGLQDSTELGIPDMKISATDLHGYTTSTFADDEGKYDLPLDTGSYSIQIESYSGCWVTGEPNPFDIYIAESHTDTISTPFFIEGDEQHVTSVQTSGVPRCNRDVIMNFILTNDGCKTLNGEVSIIIDPLINEFEPMLSFPYEVFDQFITFRSDSLLPGESRIYKVLLHLPGPEFLGLTMKHRLRYLYELEDGTLDNLEHANTFYSVVRCAFDPNDKLVSPDRSGELGDTYVINEDLLYTIRFQNTGNDTAFSVRLEDEISTLLDLSTLRPVDASHGYRIEIKEETRMLIVYFDDIMLPDSNTNRAGSEGYFSFLIRPVGNLDDFTPVYNTAGIYFDLNPPILTNNTEVIYISDFSILTIGTTQTGKDEPMIYPNPTTGKLFFDLSQLVEVEVFDILGRKVSFEIDGNQIDLSAQQDGIYAVVFRDSAHTFSRKVIVRR